ncbi:hypothetical protein TNCV_3624681 [Trichonephila clavipes]|nr:hypothetical protein TNCV_3624681 [Trichonephila clavipes]
MNAKKSSKPQILYQKSPSFLNLFLKLAKDLALKCLIPKQLVELRLRILVGKTERKGEERKKENEKKKKKNSETTRAGRFRKRRGESQSFLFGDADQESETQMSKNALRTGRRQAVE